MLFFDAFVDIHIIASTCTHMLENNSLCMHSVRKTESSYIEELYYCFDKPIASNDNYMWQSRVEIEHYSVAYFDRHCCVRSSVAQNFR